MGLTTTIEPLAAFAVEVGPPDAGPVACVGGRTQWEVGGPSTAGVREVRAPTGVVGFEPAEMTVRVWAGTTVADLDRAVADQGQTTALPAWPGATVGGVLAVGHSGIRRLGYGPVRDTLLEARFVSADGRLVKAGGPTVKNVSGYDLCRLLVGSLGTIGFLGEVLLRTRPQPETSCWLAGDTDPFALRHRLHRPVSILWDGTTTWVCLEGHAADVAAQVCLAGLTEAAGPPPVPPNRRSLPPGALRDLKGRFLAEIGVGVVHVHEQVPVAEPATTVADLQLRVKGAFDPTGRLNPGRVAVASRGPS